MVNLRQRVHITKEITHSEMYIPQVGVARYKTVTSHQHEKALLVFP